LGVESTPRAPAPDLRKIYRRFALILTLTIVILSAGFGTALYFIMKNRRGPVHDDQLMVQQERENESRLAKEKEEEHKRDDFRKLMIEGGTALADCRFEEAGKSYQGALRLFPEDVEAAKGLAAVRTALDERGRAKKEEEKRQSEFARLMDEGQDAMKNQQFARAVRAFENALQLIPDHVAAAKALQDASDALMAQETAKKRTADYESHMTAARAAMVGQRYAEARNEFLAALQNKPQDPAALDGHKQAEKRLNELQEEAKAQADFNRLMDQGDRALRNRRYEEAERAYGKAVALLPRNLDARHGLREAQKGVEKMKQDFNRLMQQGDLAMQALRFGDAVRAYNQAAKLFPDSEAANNKLQTAQKALDDLGNAQASYNRLMLQAGTSMRLGRFADASVAYGAALRLVPGDLDALAGLRSARAGMFGPPLVPVFP
jgi:cytochrome c-type biogenesis protein CcmH/NrfG